MFNIKDSGDFIEIGTLNDLLDMRYKKDGFFRLVDDIDASETSDWDNGKGWVPIGTEEKPFSGYLEGDEYSISNLFINRPNTDNVGLIGFANGRATIEDLDLLNCNIRGNYSVGGLVGYLDYPAREKPSIIESCVSGEIIGKHDVGGLVGFNGGTVKSCNSLSRVCGEKTVGGLVGINHQGEIIESVASGEIIGKHDVGGLVGHNSDGCIVLSMTSANVIGECDNVGGLVGINDGEIFESYAIGDVNGNDNVGGLVGCMGLEDCYGRVNRTYATGLVNGKGESVGGLVGWIYGGLVEFSYWDKQTTGQRYSSGRGDAKTTQEMKMKATFKDWDFENIWSIDNGTTYPELQNSIPDSIIQIMLKTGYGDY